MKKILTAIFVGLVSGLMFAFGIVFAEEGVRPYQPIGNLQFWIIGSLLVIILLAVIVKLGKTMRKRGHFKKMQPPIKIYYSPKIIKVRDKSDN